MSDNTDENWGDVMQEYDEMNEFEETEDGKGSCGTVTIVCDDPTNAYLYAAAPEMLEALKEILGISEGADTERDSDLEITDIADAAIAKAEGKSR